MEYRQIAEAKREYVAGRGSIREIALRFNIPETTLANHAYKKKWAEERSANLALKPITDFQQTLMAWRNRYLDLIAEVEGKVMESVRALKPENSKGALDCARAIGILAESYREVAGIPKIAPIKTEEKKEKQIPIEINPLDSQPTESQSDT